MEEGKEKFEVSENNDFDKVFSKAIRAGKRTYFFDVKATKSNDHYVTITESKKRYQNDGRYFYEKHKIFLFKEDFDKFLEGLEEAIDYIQTSIPTVNADNDDTNSPSNDYTDVDFDDLEKVNVTIGDEAKD
jgi:hypothetical protein